MEFFSPGTPGRIILLVVLALAFLLVFRLKDEWFWLLSSIWFGTLAILNILQYYGFITLNTHLIIGLILTPFLIYGYIKLWKQTKNSKHLTLKGGDK